MCASCRERIRRRYRWLRALAEEHGEPSVPCDRRCARPATRIRTRQSSAVRRRTSRALRSSGGHPAYGAPPPARSAPLRRPRTTDRARLLVEGTSAARTGCGDASRDGRREVRRQIGRQRRAIQASPMSWSRSPDLPSSGSAIERPGDGSDDQLRPRETAVRRRPAHDRDAVRPRRAPDRPIRGQSRQRLSASKNPRNPQ
jgi:hypothetical protein